MSSRTMNSEVGLEREESESGSEERTFEYFGWVYHLGFNSIGHEFCHLRFLFLRGKCVAMYKRDPHENPGLKPIRKGVVSHTLMVEDLGRRKVDHGDVFVLRFYNWLDETKKGEIACATVGEARKWMEAFDHAKQQAEYALLKGTSRHKLNMETELNLEGHRPRVRRYAKKLIRIGKGPEKLLRQSSNLGSDVRPEGYLEEDVTDAAEAHQWKCVCTLNGTRIFEDVASLKGDKGFLVKAVTVVDASADVVFEAVLSLDHNQRNEWDTLTGDLELVDSINGHYDVVHATYSPQHLTRWSSKIDFVFSRQWFRGQDGTYIILQFPAVHKKRPPISGYRRKKINPSTWEIRRLDTSPSPNGDKCLLTQMLEMQSSGWGSWKKYHCSKFDRTVPYALLCQVTGLREYFLANPALRSDSSMTIVHSNTWNSSTASIEFEDPDSKEEFYDAIAADKCLEDEDSDEELDLSKGGRVKLRNVSWAIASLSLNKSSVLVANNELDSRISAASLDTSQFHGSMCQGRDETDSNCWTYLGGEGFVIRGKTYLKDCAKVVGGDPLLKLLAVDWFMSDEKLDKMSLHPKSLVQSEPGKKLPFILVINLEIPAKPNYSLVLYYGANRPIKEGSLLSKFVNGTDTFRDARFKLIPRIVEGYWMVKRAVGTKACLLGKAVKCTYLQQDNFLEIDVDIGSSSVARSIIGLVLGYVTSIVVDLAILIEAKEENELPEYILGTVRLNRVRPDSAVEL